VIDDLMDDVVGLVHEAGGGRAAREAGGCASLPALQSEASVCAGDDEAWMLLGELRGRGYH
jgi:hypothetical protein